MTLKLTAEGKKVLLRGLAGETINFTKVVLGNGLPQTEETATALSNPLLTLSIDSKSTNADYITLSARFNNSGVADGFRITEIGCFTENSESGKEDVLYAIGYEDEGTADYVPSVSERLLEMQIDTMVFVGEAENVSAVIGSSIVYVSLAQFEAHLKAENPHGVTAAQVGLGNVPNETTNSQKPTYTAKSNLMELVSGETLGNAFAKIATAVKTLIAHTNRRSNPHEVTADQTGAAKKAHTHSANDINSGVLNVERGGTGVNSLDNLREAVLLGASDKLFAYGSYIGDGTYGENHPTAITYRTVPKMILVMPQSQPSNRSGGMIALAGVTEVLDGGLAQTASSNGSSRTLTWQADRVSWYGYSAQQQLNESGMTYYYLIIY